jgi:hypothetical protein
MDTRELRELAKRATPGPWCWESVAEKSNEFVVGIAFDKNGKQLSGCINGKDYDEETSAWVEDAIIRRGAIGANESGHANFADAEYIAALSPDVLEGLCDERDRLERSRDDWQEDARLALCNRDYWKQRWESAMVDLSSVIAERDALRAERDRLQQNVYDFENREALVCPEDVGCDEYIPLLKRKLDEAEAENERLRDALRDYGQHNSTCKLLEIGAAFGGTCSCGWELAQKSTHPAPDQKGKL